MRYGIIIVALLAAGCGSQAKKQVAELQAHQDEFKIQIAALTQQSRALSDELAALKATPAPAAVPTAVPAVPTGTNALPANLAAALAERISQALGPEIDSRIADRVGSREDIEAIFSEVVEEELAAKEEAERRERDVRRMEMQARWDTMRLERLAKDAGLSDEQQTQVAALREQMQQTLRQVIPELRQQNAGWREILAATADARASHDTALQAVMTAEQFATYNTMSGISEREDRNITRMADTVSLDEQQAEQVRAAYGDMRRGLRDGFFVISQDLAEGLDPGEGFSMVRGTYTEQLKGIMSDEQFTTYQAEWREDRRGGWGRR